RLAARAGHGVERLPDSRRAPRPRPLPPPLRRVRGDALPHRRALSAAPVLRGARRRRSRFRARRARAPLRRPAGGQSRPPAAHGRGVAARREHQRSDDALLALGARGALARGGARAAARDGVERAQRRGIGTLMAGGEVATTELVRYLDELLEATGVPDYGP